MAERTLILPLGGFTRVLDPKERRRKQNRVNQRARRQRQHLLAGAPQQVPDSSDHPRSNDALSELIGPQHLNHLRIIGPDAAQSGALISRLEAAVYAQHAMGTPRTDLLLGLNQLNILRALVINIEVLGLRATDMHDDALSAFSTTGPRYPGRPESQLPSSLMPTFMQRSVAHHPWLDLLPVAKLRDNLIQADAALLLDDVMLCHDLCGHQSAEEGFSGVIVWKDPWDPTGWEVTPMFLQRWGWVLRDCWDLFHSTNYWRARRDESQLHRETWEIQCNGEHPNTIIGTT